MDNIIKCELSVRRTVLLSGIAWTIVYIELIRKGFKDKTCAMPLYALGLIRQFDIYILLTGIVCSVFDIIYIIMLAKMKNRLKSGRR